MKKQKTALFAVLFSLCLSGTYPVQAAEYEILRGEEEELEIFLEGSEEAYAVVGQVSGTGDYLTMKNPSEENSRNYQALVLEEEGAGGTMLLSNRGADTYGAWLRMTVEANRIGTGTVSFPGVQMTDENCNWLEEPKLQDIVIKVLPNPLVVELAGETGNNDWYISDVTVTVSDKDAAEIWYDLGEGKLTYTEPVVITDGETTLTVSSDDGYGYKKEEVRMVNVDTVAPKFTVPVQELAWQPETIELVVECTEETSGLERSVWAFSEETEYAGSWNTLEKAQTLTMEQDGSWYLYLEAIDNAGNATEAVYGPYQKDSVKPEIVFENLSQGQLIEERIVPEITITDERSGIREITYFLDGENWSPAEITGKGKHTITVTAEDMAGNTHTETMEFSIYDGIEVVAGAGDTYYTGTASFSALVTYRGEPLPRTKAEFFLNGEQIGTFWTNRDGMAWIHLPMLLSPQEAELKVSVPQDDKRFFLAAESVASFTVLPKPVRLVYSGDINVWAGEKLRISIGIEEHWRWREFHRGDITKAELRAELYRVEEDGSRSFVEEICLAPNERGYVTHEFEPETGLYELKVSFTENSWYTGGELVQRLSVTERYIKPGWQDNGKEPDDRNEDKWNPGNDKQENNGKENEKQDDKGKDKNNGKKK